MARNSGLKRSNLPASPRSHPGCGWPMAFIAIAMASLVRLNWNVQSIYFSLGIQSDWDKSASSAIIPPKQGAGGFGRVIALCICSESKNGDYYDPLDVSLRRLSDMVPEISYAGMHKVVNASKEGFVSIVPEDLPSCQDLVEKHVRRSILRNEMETGVDKEGPPMVIEMIYSPSYEKGCSGITSRQLHESIVGPSLATLPLQPGAGFHAPPTKVHFKRNIHQWGEVFHREGNNCDPNGAYYRDMIHFFRSRWLTERQRNNCAVVHYPQILSWGNSILKGRIEDGASPSTETVLSMLTRRRSIDEAQKVLDSKSDFCVMLTLTTMQPFYAVDALVRHALARLLSKKYKPCAQMPVWKEGKATLQQKYNFTPTGPHNTYKVQGPFKFVIAMPNEMSNGYLVEKTVHPYLAGSLAISAVPDIGKYVNAEVMVPCRIDPEAIARVQKYYRGGLNWMPFNSTPDDWAKDPSIKSINYNPYAKDGIRDEPVLEFVTNQWEEALQPCVDEVIRLDTDDNAYIRKLMEPYLLHEGRRSMFDGTYLATSMLYWFIWAKSPLVEGLDSRLENMEGMLEQTPGWGLP